MREFGELRDLIEVYAAGYLMEQKMALKVVSGAYLPSLEGGLRGDLSRMQELVEGIIRGHGYFVEHGESGGLHPQSVYAVLNLAKYSGTEEDRLWGTGMLFGMLREVGVRGMSGRGYVKHVADAGLISASLNQISAAAKASRSTFAWAN